MKVKRHIDDEQPASVQEHFDLLMADKSCIEESREEISIQNLPDWYDEKLFKEGQNYCRRNRYGITSAQTLGVLAALIDPHALQILVWTKQSGTPCTAFKRYLQTMIHSKMLNMNDINDPTSSWWKSINVIKCKHATTTKKSGKFGPGKILNYNMIIAQFGFIGYTLLMPNKFGLTNQEQERKGFNHLWRVIGHLLGIPDKLNICRKNETETTKLCQKIKDEIIIKNMINEPEKFEVMAHAFLNGIWYINPRVNADSLLYFWYNISGLEYKKPLEFFSKLNYKLTVGFTFMLGVPIVGDVLRFLTYYYIKICIWNAVNFNVLAWLHFGRNNTKIKLYPHVK